LTKRGGLLLLLGASSELLALSFYGLKDFHAFILQTLHFDLKTFVPNIDSMILISPFLLILGSMILSSVLFSYISFSKTAKIESIEIERKISDQRRFAGDLVLVELTIRNKTMFWISNLFISDIVPDTFDIVFGENYASLTLPPRGEVTFSYVLRCGTRGVYYIGPLQVVFQDKVSLFMKEHLVENKTEIIVYPSYEDVRRFEFLQKMYGGLLFGRYRVREKGHGYDFWGLRKYQIGDSLKFVDWKTTAKKGELYVKEYESEKNVKMYIFIDCGLSMGVGSKRFTKLDYATRAAILLAYIANRGQDFFGLVAYSDKLIDFLPARRGRRHFYNLLDKMARLEPRGVSNLQIAMREFILREPRFSLAVIISDLEGDPSNIEEGIRIALAHKVYPIIIAPIGPLFERLYGDKYTEALKEIALAEYMKQRYEIKEKLAKYGVFVIDVGPEDILAATLEVFLRAKGRSIAIV